MPMLTQAKIDQWYNEGYCVATTFFTAAEVSALQAEVKNLQERGKIRNVRTAGDGETYSDEKVNLQLCPASPHSELIRALAYANKVTDTITALVGGPNILQLDQIFLKPAGNGDGTNWHQDNAYFGAQNNAMGTGMWIAVHEANAANGTMCIIPNSYKGALDHSRDPHSDHHIRCYPNEDQAITIEVPAGGVLFFNYGIAHCTGPNTTTTDRAGLALHFHHADIPLGPGHIRDKTTQIRPKIDGGDYGMTEYGVDLRGVFAHLVESYETTRLQQP